MNSSKDSRFNGENSLKAFAEVFKLPDSLLNEDSVEASVSENSENYFEDIFRAESSKPKVQQINKSPKTVSVNNKPKIVSQNAASSTANYSKNQNNSDRRIRRMVISGLGIAAIGFFTGSYYFTQNAIQDGGSGRSSVNSDIPVAEAPTPENSLGSDLEQNTSDIDTENIINEPVVIPPATIPLTYSRKCYENLGTYSLKSTNLLLNKEGTFYIANIPSANFIANTCGPNYSPKITEGDVDDSTNTYKAEVYVLADSIDSTSELQVDAISYRPVSPVEIAEFKDGPAGKELLCKLNPKYWGCPGNETAPGYTQLSAEETYRTDQYIKAVIADAINSKCAPIEFQSASEAISRDFDDQAKSLGYSEEMVTTSVVNSDGTLSQPPSYIEGTIKSLDTKLGELNAKKITDFKNLANLFSDPTDLSGNTPINLSNQITCTPNNITTASSAPN